MVHYNRSGMKTGDGIFIKDVPDKATRVKDFTVCSHY